MLDILSARSKRGRITGELLVGGKPRTRAYKREIGYVRRDVPICMSELYYIHTHKRTYIHIYTYYKALSNPKLLYNLNSAQNLKDTGA